MARVEFLVAKKYLTVTGDLFFRDANRTALQSADFQCSAKIIIGLLQKFLMGDHEILLYIRAQNVYRVKSSLETSPQENWANEPV